MAADDRAFTYDLTTFEPRLMGDEIWLVSMLGDNDETGVFRGYGAGADCNCSDREHTYDRERA